MVGLSTRATRVRRPRRRHPLPIDRALARPTRAAKGKRACDAAGAAGRLCDRGEDGEHATLPEASTSAILAASMGLPGRSVRAARHGGHLRRIRGRAPGSAGMLPRHHEPRQWGRWGGSVLVSKGGSILASGEDRQPVAACGEPGGGDRCGSQERPVYWVREGRPWSRSIRPPRGRPWGSPVVASRATEIIARVVGGAERLADDAGRSPP
jgi:hypothetical protein